MSCGQMRNPQFFRTLDAIGISCSRHDRAEADQAPPAIALCRGSGSRAGPGGRRSILGGFRSHTQDAALSRTGRATNSRDRKTLTLSPTATEIRYHPARTGGSARRDATQSTTVLARTATRHAQGTHGRRHDQGPDESSGPINCLETWERRLVEPRGIEPLTS